MDKAKIRLSPEEMELVTNADWILTKKAIIAKSKAIIGRLANRTTTFIAIMFIISFPLK